MFTEILMFFYTYSYMFISIVEYDFFIQKACLSDLKYNQSICNDLPNHKNINKEVQLVVTNFLKYKNIIDKILPIFMAYFIAIKAENVYRKLGLMIGFLGKILYAFIIFLNVYNFNLKLNYCYLSFIPLIITGGDILISSMIYSILVNNTKKKNLKFRISILQAFYFLSMPIGLYSSKILFYNYLKNNSLKFEITFLIYFSILSLCFIYIMIMFYREKERTYVLTSSEERQEVFNLNNNVNVDNNVNTNKTSIIKHIKNTLDYINIYKGFKNIPSLSVKLLFVCAMLYSFQKDEKSYIYLYTIKTFGWNGNDFNLFKLTQYILMCIVLVICLPLVNKFTNISEFSIICAATISGILGKMFYYFSYKWYYLYIGLLLGCLNPCSSVMIKAYISRLIDPKHINVTFVLLNIFDIIVMSFSNLIYGIVYELSIDYRFSDIFALSAFSQFLLFTLNIIINVLEIN